MDKAALTPDPSPAESETLSYDAAGCVRLSAFLHTRTAPRRNGDLPPTVPAPLFSSASSVRPRTDVLEGLRTRIRAIERGPLNGGLWSASHVAPAAPHSRSDAGERVSARAQAWSGPAALDTAATHEIKPSSNAAGAYAAALAYALGLARRRQERLSRPGTRTQARILWCATQAASGEFGRLYGPGLARFGLDASAFIIVETARTSETLWAMEEGLKSGAVALVIGCLDNAALTPARRLSLAAKEHATPCLLITNARSAVAGATATRWRIGAEPSARHAFDPRAPGALRLAATLERCRGWNFSADARFDLEWCYEALCFRMAAAVANREIAPSHACHRTG